jgi:hypothetical protein
MKLKTYTLAALSCFTIATTAQLGWGDVGGNFAADNFSPRIATVEDTVFVAYYNPASQKVDFKKYNGSNWVTLGSYTSKSNVLDIEIDNDGSVLVATIRATNNDDNTAEEFYLQVHRYSSGTTALYIDEFIAWNGICTSCAVASFDFAVNPIGGYGVVFRFNEHFRSHYKAKTGTNTWHSSLVFAQDPNGSTLSGVKDAQLIYTNFGATIISRNENSFGGSVNAMVIHKLEHNLTQSEPISYEVLGNYPILSSPNIDLDAENGIVYITATDNSQNAKVYSHTPQSGSLTSGSLLLALDLGDEVFEAQLAIHSNGDKYIAYVYENGMLYPGKIDKYSASFLNPVTVGGTNYNALGNMVGDYDFTLIEGQPIVAFQYGPPFNKAMVRKYGCVPAPQNFSFNTTTQTISSPTNIGGTPAYEWFDCVNESPISGATSATFQPTTSGSYAVEITNEGCITQSNCVAVNLSTSGIEETNSIVQIFPNPTNGMVTVISNSVGKFIIYTLSGQKIMESILPENGQLDFSTFDSGIYYLTLESQHSVSTHKIVVVK